ncbi:myosin-binding protein 7 [Elaeis guineensis]|uniref:Myosin-binding protein 7 n=1 Tax=Elaeis guineensis var. tenera TaxID=51953 RepID=A0A6I9QL71_ELAGV|nr:myosin-binding protein 7 [Elaeis guineensis]
MDSERSSPECLCASCPCCSPPSTIWRRSVKRKLDPAEDETRGDPPVAGDVARVEVANEVAALREALATQQQTIQELCVELEEERNASSTAASEAMSMILRLQREKAEVQMEARQFKRFAEEKMAHDQRELAALDDLLYKRDQVLQSLSYELQACKHRLLSYGIAPDADDYPQTPAAAAADSPRFDDLLADDNYPQLRCNIPGDDNYMDATDLDKYAFGETPTKEEEELQNLEHRTYRLATTSDGSHVMEKGVVGQSPCRPGHFRQPSPDSCGSYSFPGRDDGQEEFKNQDEFPVTVDRPLDDVGGDDAASDRVYTIDAVHGVLNVGVCEGHEDTPREKRKRDKLDGEEEEGATDIKKLYKRLQALEADRESMRQAIISMRTEKAQLVLLKEIAQQLCKEVAPQREIVQKKPLITSFSVISVVKWIVSLVFWRKKATRSKYTFGHSNNNVGLLLLLEKSPRMSQWRCLTTTEG